MNPDARIYVAGHRGMVGSAVCRALAERGYSNLLVADRSELDLLSQAAVNDFFKTEAPDVVIFAAARVGGIHANDTYSAEFIYQNLAMEVNSIHAAWAHGCSRFLFLGSTCIYPREAPQPMPETCLLTSQLEPTNEAYAVAKIAGVKMCEHYRKQYGVKFHSAMPTNLYGPGDNYHPENSHVLPSLLRRFHEAKQKGAPSVTIWGSGKPRREFLHVDDLAAAILHLVELDDPPNLINVGTGSDVSIIELSELIAKVVGYDGEVELDPTKPDGTMIKRTDTTLINETGWYPAIGLETGLRKTYRSFLQELEGSTLRSV